MSATDPRYLKGIDHFNKREFFDAHEVWEELWRVLKGEEARFVQGLIQLATALHHFQAQNLRGAKILYEGGKRLLSPLGENYWGLPLNNFLEQISLCFQELHPYQADDLPGRYHPEKHNFPTKINKDLIPRIELTSHS